MGFHVTVEWGRRSASFILPDVQSAVEAATAALRHMRHGANYLLHRAGYRTEAGSRPGWRGPQPGTLRIIVKRTASKKVGPNVRKQKTR